MPKFAGWEYNMHIMGLADRVAEIREEFGRQTGLEAHQNALKPSNSVYASPRWESGERIPKQEIDSILGDFGVESKLKLIRQKYWGCGQLFRLHGGYRLYTSYRETAGYETVTHPATEGYSYVTHNGMPEKGSIYMQSVTVPGIPEHTEQRSRSRIVRHAIVAIVGELKTQDSSDQEQRNLALFVAIGINPASFLGNSANKSFDEETSSYLVSSYIQAAIRKLGSGKYTPPTYPKGNLGVFRSKVALTSYDALYPKEFTRDYAVKPFAPWDIFVKGSKPSELDDFLAEYIVDADLDQKSIKQAADEARIG